MPTSSLISQEKIGRAVSSFGQDYINLVFCRFQKPCGITKAVTQKAPSFHDVSNFFGENATLFWLRFHIAETFAFIGIYDTASKEQVRQTADLILSHEVYGQLTLSEFLCFLQRFKMGSYGKIYQSNRPNPQEFLMCLQPFWEELSKERGKLIEKERREKDSLYYASDDRMTREEWEEIKMLTKMYEMKLWNRLNIATLITMMMKMNGYQKTIMIYDTTCYW